MKKKILLIASLLLLSSCSLLSGNGSSFDPWDKLGGGGIASVGSEENISINDYENISNSFSSEQLDESTNSEKVINLSDLKSLPSGVSVSGSTVTISLSGTYLLKGTLKGQIIVDKCNDKDVKLIFDGISVQGNSATAPITFKKTSANRIVTLKEGTTSTIEDSSLNQGTNSDESIIEVKTCPLTINGKGKLVLKANGNNSNGIESNDTLSIINSTIEIRASNHGIKADNKISIEGANISIYSSMDGIKTDVSPLSLDEAKTLASSLENGYISIKNTSLYIEAGDDGISANSLIYIENDSNSPDVYPINIIANNGTPKSDSNTLNGKGIKVEGIRYLNGSVETIVPSTHEDNYSLIINGGYIKVNANDDSLSSKGNTLIEDGNLILSTGDDGIHSEYTSIIRNGKVEILECNEGIEGAGVEIYGGEISIISSDDGINASNSNVKDYDTHIYIAGGSTLVNAQGDGVDSNGWMKVDGGELFINGPTSGMNGSLDSDRGILVNKGTIVAVGSRGMVETPSSNSTQCYININLSTTSREKIIVTDSSNKEIINFIPEKQYQSVVITCEEFVKGNTYYVLIGETTYEATLNSIGTALGTNSSGNQNQGHMPGGPGGGRPR